MGLLFRIIAGNSLRKTRLHTYSGSFVDMGALRYLPNCIWSVVLLKAFHHRQQQPWLGYRAVKHLGGLIQPDWTILESGSGMSSIFFATRCQKLFSIESEENWFKVMQGIFRDRGINNVDYRLLSGDEYVSMKYVPDRSIDLVVVDGLMRDRVMDVAIQKVKPGGYIFLDNSDVPYDDHRAARQKLVAASRETKVFKDFSPFQIAIDESLLGRMPG